MVRLNAVNHLLRLIVGGGRGWACVNCMRTNADVTTKMLELDQRQCNNEKETMKGQVGAHRRQAGRILQFCASCEAHVGPIHTVANFGNRIDLKQDFGKGE